MRGGRKLKWNNDPTTTSNLDGIWNLNEINNLINQTKWPRGPAAPTGLSATAGNTQLSLSWTAPTTTHGTITNYLVEYTASGGSAQYVLTGSTGTSYTLTGLTNGTSYTVRVAAVNFTAGDYSGTATGTPSAAAVSYLSGTSGGISGTGNSSASKFKSVSNSNLLTVTINTAGSYVIQLEGDGRRIFKNNVARDWSDGGIVFPEDNFYVFSAVSVAAGTTVGVDPGNRFHIWKV